MLEIFIDADGCPVKPEVYRVAQRYGLHVTVVANAWMRIPYGAWLELVVVEGQFDAADDWIVEHVTERDIVISGDIPLAARVFAVVDVWDALRSDRPYRLSWPEDHLTVRALPSFRNGSGNTRRPTSRADCTTSC